MSTPQLHKGLSTETVKEGQCLDLALLGKLAMGQR